MRAIAADAGVDVAMVYYFFGNKEGLINAAALTGPEHPLHQLASAPRRGDRADRPAAGAPVPRTVGKKAGSSSHS